MKVSPRPSPNYIIIAGTEKPNLGGVVKETALFQQLMSEIAIQMIQKYNLPRQVHTGRGRINWDQRAISVPSCTGRVSQAQFRIRPRIKDESAL